MLPPPSPAVRNSGARSGDLVSVQGLGGLGHLGVQYAKAMGFEVVAIARGSEKEAFAHELGASRYLDSEPEDAGAALARQGGARAISHVSGKPRFRAVPDLQ